MANVPTPEFSARARDEQLLAFCVAQQGRIEREAWLAKKEPIYAAAARFLAEMDWYGDRATLLEIAESMAPAAGGLLSEIVKRTEFDCARFAHLLPHYLSHR